MTEQDGFNCRCRPKPERRMDETILRFRAMLAGWQAFKTDPESGTFYAFSRGVKVFERYMAEHELEERYRYEQARGGTE